MTEQQKRELLKERLKKIIQKKKKDS